MGARAELHGEDPEAPHTQAGALRPRRRARRGPASTSVRGRWQAGEGGAALRGASGRVCPHGANPRCSCAAVGGQRVGCLADSGAVQVIEVPKILIDVIPARSLVLEPQTAEQLVEVPTVQSPTRIALQIAEQIVDTTVPQGHGGKRRVPGFLPEQSSTATSSSLERISERTLEQIVDISSSGGGLGHGSSSSAGLADEDFAGVFRNFLQGKKCGVPGRW